MFIDDRNDQDEDIADVTIDQYYRIYKQLEARVIKEVGILNEYGLIIRVSHWLETNRTRWRPTTFRLYRAAFQFVYERVMGVNRDRNTVHLWYTPVSNKGMKIPKRGPAKRSKKLPPDDLWRLVQELRNGRSIFGKAAANYLIASIACGLRPHEWSMAELIAPQEDGDLWRLLVRNGKQTQGRAHGPTRTIHLSNPGKDVLDALDGTLAFAKAKRNPTHYRQALEGIRKCLQRASQKLWPKRLYCLYSGRHQAAANFKALYSREEVAALLGHASIRTAATHYGRRKAGKVADGRIVLLRRPDGSGLSMPAVQPSPHDVAAVIRIQETRAKLVGRAHPKDDDDLEDAQNGPRIA